MSTRSQIKTSYLHWEVLLHHHWDGYPKGVGADSPTKATQHLGWKYLRQ